MNQEGANAKCMAKFYLAIVQAVLLYGSESWVISTRDYKKLRSFHFRSIRHMRGKHIRKLETGWEYLNHEELMNICGILPIETYREKKRNSLEIYGETMCKKK